MSVAREWFARSIDKFRSLAIPSGTGTALSAMASVTLVTGDVDLAERLLDEATSVLRNAGPWFLTWTLYVRAILSVRRGNPDKAIALLRESLTRIRDLHDQFAFVYALVPLAAAAVLKGDDTWAAGFSAPGMPSPNVLVSRSSTERSRISGNIRNARLVPALAPIAGAGPMRPGVSPPSTR